MLSLLLSYDVDSAMVNEPAKRPGNDCDNDLAEDRRAACPVAADDTPLVESCKVDDGHSANLRLLLSHPGCRLTCGVVDAILRHREIRRRADKLELVVEAVREREGTEGLRRLLRRDSSSSSSSSSPLSDLYSAEASAVERRQLMRRLVLLGCDPAEKSAPISGRLIIF